VGKGRLSKRSWCEKQYVLIGLAKLEQPGSVGRLAAQTVNVRAQGHVFEPNRRPKGFLNTFDPAFQTSFKQRKDGNHH